MWFLPSYGRPAAIQKLWQTGLMPESVIVVINEDDPCRSEYENMLGMRDREPTVMWELALCPAGSRFCDVWDWIYKTWPDLPWYGMLGDDHIPRTQGWHEEMVAAAADRYLAYPNGDHTEFPLMRGVCVIGGELVRQMGWIVLPGLRHNFCDCVLDLVARDNNLLRPLEHHRVDHLHWKFVAGVVRDHTYERGSADQNEDMWRWHNWLTSADRMKLNMKIGHWLATASSAPPR